LESQIIKKVLQASKPKGVYRISPKSAKVTYAEALTTGRMIPSGTNSPLAEVSTHWY